VEAVSGVWRFTREPGGHRQARSLPGHLFHLVIGGAYHLRSNGRTYRIERGDVIYYHESERVDWLGNTKRVEFYSVGFLAPAWPPLPIESRVFPGKRELEKAFERLYRASLRPHLADRTLCVYAELLGIMRLVDQRLQRSPTPPAGDTRWWNIEKALRERRTFRTTLDALCKIAHSSRASVVRACRKTTGRSPMQRLKQMRLDEARGLLLYSDLTVSQVAEYLGYPRVHEFSREFSKRFGMPPSAARTNA
jgi:AraC-like DNA-binding protein